ncbi:11018_t:CDS:2 [Acaulospora colombiana]|uniref:11018_t:CDS:1 n=1 Tax=Acaulospora colombiana TaxID=27376 RepID=A0ACA9MXN5_9GLOM|nr:11018_t:CDS:2 [Acaulospora colombiana]
MASDDLIRPGSCIKTPNMFRCSRRSGACSEWPTPSLTPVRVEKGDVTRERHREGSLLVLPLALPFRFTGQSSPRNCTNPCKIESHCVLLPISILLFVASCHVAVFLETSILFLKLKGAYTAAWSTFAFIRSSTQLYWMKKST